MEKTQQLQKAKAKCNELLGRYNDLAKKEIDDLIQSLATFVHLQADLNSEHVNKVQARAEKTEADMEELEFQLQVYESYIQSTDQEEEFINYISETTRAVENKKTKGLFLIN